MRPDGWSDETWRAWKVAFTAFCLCMAGAVGIFILLIVRIVHG